MAFVDSGFGGPIVDRCRQLGYTNVVEVQFGAACPDPRHYANMRAWMWSKVREFLTRGAIDKDTRLATDLAGPSAKMDRQDRICLESKEEMEKRGLDSRMTATPWPLHSRTQCSHRKSNPTRKSSTTSVATTQGIGLGNVLVEAQDIRAD
jgi:hypothetical protein